MEQVRRRAQKEELRRPAIELLNTHKISLQGHFDLGNGQHSTQYRNPHAIFDTPSHVWQLAQCLIDLSIDANEADVIAGPTFGGAILAYVMAGLLSGQSKPGSEVKRYVPLKETKDGYVIREHYRQFVTGRRIWLVDDVCRTGQTLSLCAAALEEHGGRVIATSVILQNMQGMLIRDPSLKDVHLEHIQTFSASSIPVGDCPQCLVGVPITKF
ncbi:MAG TPA: phosphoribosyltransferase family protein [Methylomirabilota bacterium]|nr:phosphoribosyltransferase family protein [Methylomirabilota bacterium]